MAVQLPTDLRTKSGKERTLGERRIGVIMFTDIVGYTLLAPVKAMRLLDEHRRLLRPAFARYEGREVKTIGDAFLVEFASAVSAVRCAIEIQRLVSEQNTGGTTERIQLRIGINVGEVIHSENDVYGYAVNVASRIVSLAEPGGICISKQVYDFIWDEVDIQIDKVGPIELKNVKVPTDVYRVVLSWQAMGKPLGGGGDGPSISSLIPGLFKLHRPIADGNSPLVHTGFVLNTSEVHILPVMKGLRPRRDRRTGLVLYGALSGYSFLEKFMKTKPKDYSDLLRIPSREIAVWIGSVKFDNPISDLLHVFEVTKFGAARVSDRDIHTVVTLADLVGAMRNHSLVSDMRVEQVGSQPLSISSDAEIREAVKMMLKFRVRRLFPQDRPGEFISSRSVIEFMFTPERLQVARRRPEEWCDAKVSVLGTQSARVVAPGAPLNEAARMMGDEPDDCLVSESGLIISRWDLVMKPWKLGHLSPGGSTAKT
ncbi:MAG: adenylate/guanylate cyclase domain-containing protein [Nitrososphaerales archaeon]|jgi:class 3 adenylate cyclase